MTESPATTCSRCGAATIGNFCASCGAPLGASTCVSCGSELAAGARFCHKCGAASRVTAAGVPAVSRQAPAGSPLAGAVRTPTSDRTPWLVAGLLIVAIIVAVGYSATRRSAPPVPAMANAGNVGPGATGDAGAPGATMVAPNIDSLSPKERFLRLQTRIDQQLERRDTTRLQFFMQMALQAYALLPESDRDIDVRFHAAMLEAESGMMPGARALADTIMAKSPGNLFGYYIRAEVAGFEGDSTKAKAARAEFRAHYDAELKKKLPEYGAHMPLLEQYRKGDGAK